MPNLCHRLSFWVLMSLWSAGEVDSFSVAKCIYACPDLTAVAIQYGSFALCRSSQIGNKFDPSLLILSPFNNVVTIAQYVSHGTSVEEKTIRCLFACIPFLGAGISTLKNGPVTPELQLAYAGLLSIVVDQAAKSNSNLGQMGIFFPLYAGYKLKKGESFALLIINQIATIVVVKLIKRILKFYKKLCQKSYRLGRSIRTKTQIHLSKLLKKKRKSRLKASLF